MPGVTFRELADPPLAMPTLLAMPVAPDRLLHDLLLAACRAVA
jgi:hypothetical protein